MVLIGLYYVVHKMSQFLELIILLVSRLRAALNFVTSRQVLHQYAISLGFGGV